MEIEGVKANEYIDQYKILKILGSGYSADVLLAADGNDRKVAIKKYKQQIGTIDIFKDELNVMRNLNHQNLIKLLSVLPHAMCKSDKKQISSCFAIVIEYAEGGELFDFIADTGKFSEVVSRTYFQQLLNGINYMHQKGYTHRDIKPQNLLMSSEFLLKISDFGFSCSLKGRDYSGILHTKLGTEGYMAPEIASKFYEGKGVDIFAAGVILFIMFSATPPFESSSPTDPYYKLIKEKRYQTFWHAHSRKRVANFFPQTFKDLVQRMIAANPKERPTILDIAKHPWIKGGVISTHSQIIAEFNTRKKKLQQILQNRKKQQNAQRLKRRETIHNQGFTNRDSQSNEQKQFMQVYNKQLLKQIKLQKGQACSSDDILLKDVKPAYIFSQLLQFLNKHQILLFDEGSQQTEQITTQQCDRLKAITVTENGKEIQATYQYKYLIENEQFMSLVVMNIVLLQNQNKQIVVHFQRKEGDIFYFKRIIREVKMHCLA